MLILLTIINNIFRYHVLYEYLCIYYIIVYDTNYVYNYIKNGNQYLSESSELLSKKWRKDANEIFETYMKVKLAVA